MVSDQGPRVFCSSCDYLTVAEIARLHPIFIFFFSLDGKHINIIWGYTAPIKNKNYISQTFLLGVAKQSR